MSRLFDALQRSGVEQTGVEYPDTVSVATQVFEMPTKEEEAPSSSLPVFPSVEVSLEASSRVVVLTEPETLAAEKFRFLGVRMRQLQQTRPVKKVLVTSTIAEEGKSLVSANLACVLASRKRHRVLLIDGDLRRPVLADKFGLGRLSGLAEWLQGESQTVSNIYHLAEPDFWLMPAGHPPANPLELMQSGRLASLMAQVTNLFDWIIVDSPPLLPLADTSVWARLTDGALLVVREGIAEKDPLKRALESLKKADLLGVVLNGSSNGNHHNYYQRYAAARSSMKS
ncbi:MAG: CpsD/CapB family tyrosine-protein kinase [Acidobacteriia bacterium]|nr:CpsD/CapB family tyrosine-protein kinase [Terriglobia bacterium]